LNYKYLGGVGAKETLAPTFASGYEQEATRKVGIVSKRNTKKKKR